MVRFKMYNMHFFQLILLLIFKSVNGYMECDCNTIAAIQEVMQKELFQIKVENSKMASRLRRLESSGKHYKTMNHQHSEPDSKHYKTMNHQHSEPVSDMTYLDPSHDKTRNDIKRIETIESTLARIVPQFESYIQNKTDDKKHRIHGQRIDKIESELALVSNKTNNLLDMNNDSENTMVQLHRTIKKAFQGEKIRILNMELEMNEKIKNIEGYCENFTRATGELIEEFKEDIISPSWTLPTIGVSLFEHEIQDYDRRVFVPSVNRFTRKYPALPCKELEPPMMGIVACNNWRTEYTRACIFACKDDFSLPPGSKPDQVYTCEASGIWLPSKPIRKCYSKLVFPINNIDTFSTCTEQGDRDSIAKFYIDLLKKSRFKSLCEDYRNDCRSENVSIDC